MYWYGMQVVEDQLDSIQQEVRAEVQARLAHQKKKASKTTRKKPRYRHSFFRMLKYGSVNPSKFILSANFCVWTFTAFEASDTSIYAFLRC